MHINREKLKKENPEPEEFEEFPEVPEKEPAPLSVPEKPKRKLPGKYFLLAAVLLILLAALLFKIFMNVSFKPAEELDTADYPKLNFNSSDNLLEVRNPNESNRGEKTGIIFYPDLRVEGECYLPLMAALAEKGYDCFLPVAYGNQPYLNLEGAETIIRKYPAIQNWILAGHSHSCPVAASYAAGHPEKLGGLVFLGGCSDRDISGLDLPLLSITGSLDTVMDTETLKTSVSNNPENTTYEELEGGNNSGFVNSVLLPGDQKAELSSEEQIGRTAELMDQFITEAYRGIVKNSTIKD